MLDEMFESLGRKAAAVESIAEDGNAVFRAYARSAGQNLVGQAAKVSQAPNLSEEEAARRVRAERAMEQFPNAGRLIDVIVTHESNLRRRALRARFGGLLLVARSLDRMLVTVVEGARILVDEGKGVLNNMPPEVVDNAVALWKAGRAP